MRSGNSLHLFFLGALLLGLLLVLLYEPREFWSGGKLLQKEQNLSDLELYDFTYKEITPEGVVVLALGQKGYKFDEEEIIEGLNLSRFLQQEQRIEVLESPLAIKRGEKLFFPQSALYIKDDASRFWSEKGEYELDKKLFKGEGRFWLVRAQDRAQGYDINYSASSGILEAKEIKAKLEMGR